MNRFYTAESFDEALRSGWCANPRIDATFKALFTSDTDDSRLALKCFLEAILEKKIESVQVMNEEPSKDYVGERGLRFDVSCHLNDGSVVEIEMQAFSEDYHFGDRALYNAAVLLNSSMKAGQNWARIPYIYQVSVLNYIETKETEEFPVWYHLEYRGNVLSDKLSVIFLELPKLAESNSDETENLTAAEKWGYFLKYADNPEKADLIRNLTKEEGIMAAEKTLLAMDKDYLAWMRERNRFIAMTDELSRRELSEEKGRAKGLAEGLAEGRAKGLAEGKAEGLAEGKAEGKAEGAIEMRHSIALAMLKDHADYEKISRYTGLTVSEVQGLAKENQLT